MSEWISCEDRMPDNQDLILMLVDSNEYGIEMVVGSLEFGSEGMDWVIGNCHFSHDYHFNCDISFEEVTHWQLLPSPPQ